MECKLHTFYVQAEVILSWPSGRLQPLSNAKSWRVRSGLLSAWMFVDIRTVLFLMADLEVKVIFPSPTRVLGRRKDFKLRTHTHSFREGKGVPNLPK